MRRLVVLCALVLVPTAGGGSYSPPPGDCCPAWSPDGTYVSFLTSRGGRALHDVKPNGTAEQTLFEGPYDDIALSPDWKELAWVDGGRLKVKTVATGRIETVASGVEVFAWAPDSARLAFLATSGIHAVGVDGTGETTSATQGRDPAWSPNGALIAYGETQIGAPAFVHVVKPDGSDDRRLVRGSFPAWSPGSDRIAAWGPGATPDLVVASLTGTMRAYKVDRPADLRLTWSPDATKIAYDSAGGVVAITLASGKVRSLAPSGFGASFSPDGKLLAYATGGECRDRVGIYVARADGSGARRITNDCRIVGTSGNDTLHGTDVADVLVGLGGNDRLFASDPGYVGDTLLGGPGNDVLIGGYRQDTLDGGPGDDVLDGGPSGDVLIGGPGHDHINGQGGADVIRAVDGQRDVIACGPNAYGPAGRDIVYADRIDKVASDCEIVHRR